MKTPMTKSPQALGLLVALVGAGMLCSAPDARAQNGRIEINHLEKLADKAAEVVDVTLDGALLQLASKFMSDKRGQGEAAAKDFIQHLQGIYVKSFEFDKDGEYSQGDGLTRAAMAIGAMVDEECFPPLLEIVERRVSGRRRVPAGKRLRQALNRRR